MPDDIYPTSDFGLAAYLATDARVRLVCARPLTPSRTQFVMAPKEVCEALARDYMSDRATVNPRLLHDRSRLLKTTLHAVRRGEQP